MAGLPGTGRGPGRAERAGGRTEHGRLEERREVCPPGPAERAPRELRVERPLEHPRIDGGRREPRRLLPLWLLAGYQNRWYGESACDEIKTHLCDCATVNRPVVFRSRRPSRAEQEYHGLLIAFDVICMLEIEAAELQPELEPGVISFVATTERLREALREMPRLPIPLLLIRREKMPPGYPPSHGPTKARAVLPPGGQGEDVQLPAEAGEGCLTSRHWA